METQEFKLSRVAEIACGILLVLAVLGGGYYLTKLDWRTEDQRYADQMKQVDEARSSIRSTIENAEAAERYENMSHDERMKVIMGKDYKSPATD